MAFSVNPQHLPDLMAFSAKKSDIRYYLNGIHITSAGKDRGAVMVATDGCRIMAVHDPHGSCDQDVIVSFKSVEIRWVALQVKAAAKHGAPPVLKGESDPACPGSIRLTVPPLQQYISAELIDGKFPNWRPVVKKAIEAEGDPNAAFNARYMQQMVSAFSSRGQNHVVKFEVKGDGGSVFRWALEDDLSAIGVIMPMRHMLADIDMNSAPSWAGGAA